MKAKSPSFVRELPLVANPHESRVLAVRFEAGRPLYNAVLGEALRRLDLMKESKAWQATRPMPSGAPRSVAQKARAAEFSLIAETMDFTDDDLQSYATHCKNACWIGDHLDAHTTARLAGRVDTARLIDKALHGFHTIQ